MEEEIHVRHHPPEEYDDPETETLDQEEDPTAARVRDYYRKAHREQQEKDRQTGAQNQRPPSQEVEQVHEEVPEEEDEEEEDLDGDASDEDVIEDSVQQDMAKLQNAFPGFRDKYRLIKRIGEGMWLRCLVPLP